MALEISKKDYSKIKEFDRIGYHYTQIAHNDEYIVWEMTKEGVRNYCVEVWKKVPYKNPDGSIVEARCIKDEEFGTYGWYFVEKNKSVMRNKLFNRFNIAI